MTISINATEAAWLSLNTITLFLTFGALMAALSSRRKVRMLDNPAAMIVANGTIRREIFRAAAQVGLLVLAFPAIFDTREVQMSPYLVVILSIPVFILANTLSDRRDRLRLESMSDSDIEIHRSAAYLELARLIGENTAITRQAVDRADAAYNEANHVNEKIAAAVTHNDNLVTEAAKKAVDLLKTAADAAVALKNDSQALEADTNEKVTEIHQKVLDDPD